MRKYIRLLPILFLTSVLSSVVQAKYENRADLKPMKVPSVEEGSEAANPRTRLGKLVRLIQLFNQRFDSKGVFVDDEKLTDAYRVAQEQFVKEMRSQGALQEILLVGNNVDNILIHGKDHFLRALVLVDERGDFLAMISEKIKYKDEFRKSLPRVFPFFSLKQGQVLIAAKDTAALIVKTSRSQSNLIEFELSVISNLIEKTMKKMVIRLVKKDDGKWAAIDIENGREIHKLRLVVEILSMNPLNPNGGIEKVEFDSRQSLDDMPNPFLN